MFIALRIYLALLISNCNAKRANSKLERVLSLRRTKMQQNKLQYFALLCSEHDLTSNLDFKDVIETFSAAKARKKPI